MVLRYLQVEADVSERKPSKIHPPQKKPKTLTAMWGSETKNEPLPEPTPRPTTKAKGRRRKNLDSLLKMPLDVLFEVRHSEYLLFVCCILYHLPDYSKLQIFSCLSPNDIISLSRTSKGFRETLMTRNATTVWKAARKRVGAPDCPPCLSEPQWAVLLFTNTCQVSTTNQEWLGRCL